MNTSEKRIARLAASNRRREQRVFAFVLAAVLVALSVAMMLERPGVAYVRQETVLDCHAVPGVAHIHNVDCYDDNGNLVCPLPEVEAHVHDDSCYEESRELVCGLEESEEHTHTDECYEVTRTLVCGQEEVTEEHVHGPGCFATVQVEVPDPVVDGQVLQPADNYQGDGQDPDQDLDISHATQTAGTLDETVEMPAQHFVGDLRERDEAGNEWIVMVVSVDAPEGALPAGTTMQVAWAEQDAIKDQVEQVVRKVDASGAALDIHWIDALKITFTDANGNEVQPAGYVDFKVTHDGIRVAEHPVLAHTLDAAARERYRTPNQAEVVADAVVVNQFDDDTSTGNENTFKVRTSLATTLALLDVTQQEAAQQEADVVVTAAADEGVGDVTGTDDPADATDPAFQADTNDADGTAEPQPLAQVFTGEAGGVAVTAEAPAGAFEGDVRMVVSPVDAEAVRGQVESAVDSEGKSVEDLAAVEISFVDGEGHELAPAAALSVSLTSPVVRDADEPALVRLGKGAEVVGDAQAVSSDEAAGAEDTLRFEGDGTGTYAVAALGTISTQVVTAGGQTLQVTVETTDTGDSARLAGLTVTELGTGDAAYWQAYDAVVAAKQAEDASFDEGALGFFAADIDLLDEAGQPFEPAGAVRVKMELVSLPADADALTTTLEVQHLAVRDGSVDVQTVSTADNVATVDDIITAEFSVDSFSTFTLTWTDDGTSAVVTPEQSTTTLSIQSGSDTYATVNVHYVDTEGNNVASPFNSAVSGETPVTIAGLLDSAITDYEYQGAHYGSYDGEAVTTIAVERTSGTTTGTTYTYQGTTGYDGRINGNNSAPSGYDAFYADDHGGTRIYFNNGRFRTTDAWNGAHHTNGAVYGARTGTVTNYAHTLTFDNEAVDPITNTGTSATWQNAADIYLVYENKGDNLSHATIHYGTFGSDGTFTELQESATLDTNATSISVNPTISGYTFLGAYYSVNATDTPAVDTKQVDHILRKVNDSWQYTNVNDSTDKESIEDNSHIYVVYREKTGSATATPSNDTNIPKPSTIKNVTSNDDGTYDVQLDIIGQQIKKSERKGANVLLIFDRTSSMTNTMTGAPAPGRRIEAARAAVHTLVDTLDPSHNPVQIAAFSFARFADPVGGPNGYDQISGVDWTETGTDITSFIDGLTLAPSGSAWQTYTYPGGTNWEAALEYANNYLQNPPDNDPTYIIFLTDGNPTVHDGTADTVGSGIINSNPNAQSTEYTAAEAAADDLSTAYKFYGILCANSSDGPLLQTLVTHLNTTGHDATHILADDSDKLTSSFEGIAQYIVSQLGAGEVSTNDGITSLSSVSASVSGAAGAFKYYKAYEVTFKDGKYTYVDDNGDEQEITDTSQIKTYEYMDSQGHPQTYQYYNRNVWTDAPGASYNEATGVTWDLGAVGTLQEGGIYSIRFTIWPSQEAYDLLADLNNGIKKYDPGYENSITDSERDQVYESGGIYYMKTNTNLDTSYSFGGDSYTDTIDYYQGAMDLDTRTISLSKLWPQNLLDAYVAGQSTNGIEDEVTLNVTKDGLPYFDVTVDRNNNWTKDDIFISCGLLTVHNGVVDIKEPGHDYTVTEPESFSYYWDLVSDVYRPMVIGYEDGENGTKHEANLLILDEKLTEADNVNSFMIDGKIYKKQESGSTTLNARNYRRSNLNLTKVVTPEGAPDDALFTYKVKVTDVATDTNQQVWFSIWDGSGYVTNTASTTYVEGATEEVNNGVKTGFYYATSGSVISIRIKKGWNVRFLNLLSGSTFEFEETGMDDGYSFVSVAADRQYALMDPDNEGKWYTVDEDNAQKITGTIIEPNNSYTVTYTNKWETKPVYVRKVDENGQELAGADFSLTRDSSTVTSFTTTTDDKELALGNGVYCLTETDAPDGYVILSGKVYFRVTDGVVQLVKKVETEVEGQTVVTYENVADDYYENVEVGSHEANGVVNLITVTNIPGAELPEAGGPGTSLLTLVGVALMAGAALWLTRRPLLARA